MGVDAQKPLDGYPEQVRKLIAARLGIRSVAAADVAEEMSMSKRTLQRRLAEEGTSYSLLLDEVRRDYTLSALTAGQQRCEELSASLGYRQQSTLTRAVQRWTGRSPSTLRR